MKRSELKKLIKPIVKECIQETLLEEGILSKVISEVLIGLNSSTNLVKEEKEVHSPRSSNGVKRTEREGQQPLMASRQKMLDAIGMDSYNGVNLFEGTDPLTNAGSPGEASSPSSPLAGVHPGDSGVDISSLAGVFGDTWKAVGNG